MLQEIAFGLVENPNVPLSAVEIEHFTDRSLVEVLTINWIQSFLDSKKIVTRRRTANHRFTSEKEKELDQRMVYLLGEMKRSFENGLDPCTVENYDECHFLIDTDDGRWSEFAGSKRLTYAEIALAGQGFTVCLRTSGGAEGGIEAFLLTFQNASGSYPISGVNDDVDGVAYRTQRKGWINQDSSARYFGESRVI